MGSFMCGEGSFMREGGVFYRRGRKDLRLEAKAQRKQRTYIGVYGGGMEEGGSFGSGMDLRDYKDRKVNCKLTKRSEHSAERGYYKF